MKNVRAVKKKIDEVVCDGNNEVSVPDIINTINLLIEKCVELQTCCNEMNQKSWLRTLREGNTLYMTNDGSAPKR